MCSEQCAMCIPGRETLLECALLPASFPRAPCNCALLIEQLCKSTASSSTTCNVQCATCNMQRAMCNVQWAVCNVQCAVLGGRSVRKTLPLLPACLFLHAHWNWDLLSFAQICKFVVSCACQCHVLCTCKGKYLATHLLLFPSSCKSSSQILPLFLMFQLQGIPWKELLLYFVPQSPPSHITCDCALLICKF